MADYIPGKPFIPENTFEKVTTYGNQLTSAYQKSIEARDRILKRKETLDKNKKKVMADMNLAGIKQEGPRQFFKTEYFDKISEMMGETPDQEMLEFLEKASGVYEVLSGGYNKNVEKQRTELKTLSGSSKSVRRKTAPTGMRFNEDFNMEDFDVLNDAYELGFGGIGEVEGDNGLKYKGVDETSGLPIVENRDGDEIIWGLNDAPFYANESYFDPSLHYEQYSEYTMYELGEQDAKDVKFSGNWNEDIANGIWGKRYNETDSDRAIAFRVSMMDEPSNAKLKEDLAETIVNVDGTERTALSLFYDGTYGPIPDEFKSTEEITGPLDIAIENAKEEFIAGTKFASESKPRAIREAERRKNRIIETGQLMSFPNSFKVPSPDALVDDFDPEGRDIFRYDLTKRLETDIKETNIAGGDAIPQKVFFRNVAFVKDHDDEGVGLVVTLSRTQQVSTATPADDIDIDEWKEARDKADDANLDTFIYNKKKYEVGEDLDLSGDNITIPITSVETYFFPGGSDNYLNIQSTIVGQFGDQFFRKLMDKAESKLGIN